MTSADKAPDAVVSDPAMLRIATGNGYPPFTDEGLPGRGVATELVESIFRSADVPYTVEFLPWNRAEKLAVAGRYAAAFPFVKTPERERDFLYSDPIYTVSVRLFARQGSRTRVGRLDDLKGKRLCRPIGYAWEADIKDLIDRHLVSLDSPTNMDACIKMLKVDRVDAVVESDFVFWPTVEHLYGGDTSGFQALDYVVATNNLYFISSRRDPHAEATMTTFNEGLRKAKAEADFPFLTD